MTFLILLHVTPMLEQGYVYFESKQGWSLWYNDGAFKGTMVLSLGSLISLTRIYPDF